PTANRTSATTTSRCCSSPDAICPLPYPAIGSPAMRRPRYLETWEAHMPDESGTTHGSRGERWHQLGFALVLLFLMLVVVLAPFAIASLFDYVVHPESNQIFSLFGANAAPAATHTRLHLDVVSLDEWGRTAQLR